MVHEVPLSPFVADTKHPLAWTRWLPIVGLLALAVPTLVAVGKHYWSGAEGSQGPIILATGAWLLWRQRARLRREAAPLRHAAWALLLVPPTLVYIFARTYGSLFGETAALYAIGLLTAAIYLGPAAIRRSWFPFVYPAFLIVPPVTIVTELTQPLRIWISTLSVDLLHVLGYPVALAGATIQIAQFELLVKTACAGLGSMFTLCAVGLFYVHLRRSGSLHAALLVLAVVPVAILANFVRVLLLILLTWYGGSTLAQGVAHESAGLLMFAFAMAGMFAVDALLGMRRRD